MQRILFACLSLALLASSVFAGTGPAFDEDYGAHYVAGPATITDAMNGVTFDLPKGWWAAIPFAPEGVPMTGVTTIANYDMGRAEYLMPGRSAHTMLPGMVKADFFTEKLEAGKTVAHWAGERAHTITTGTFDLDGTEVLAAAPVTRMIGYRLAGEDGYAYGVSTPAFSSVDVVLPWKGGDEVFFANVHQADSEALDKALFVLDTVRPAGEPPRVLAKGGANQVAEPILQLVRSELPGAKAAAIQAKGQCTSWSGSDPGTGVSNCPNTLYFPHQYAEYWQAGGAGSFWGNFWHGNCNNDYYAMDHNYMTSSSCSTYGNDIGRNVYASYSGTAANQSYDSTGYGYHVIITTTISSVTYKTLYAHLQAAGFSGAATANVTVVGKAGDSGSASGSPHLHFGIKKSGSSKCNTNGSNASCPTSCSNCEAKASPQGCKPGKMQTLAGLSNMSDGVCLGGPP